MSYVRRSNTEHGARIEHYSSILSSSLHNGSISPPILSHMTNSQSAIMLKSLQNCKLGQRIKGHCMRQFSSPLVRSSPSSLMPLTPLTSSLSPLVGTAGTYSTNGTPSYFSRAFISAKPMPIPSQRGSKASVKANNHQYENFGHDHDFCDALATRRILETEVGTLNITAVLLELNSAISSWHFQATAAIAAANNNANSSFDTNDITPLRAFYKANALLDRALKEIAFIHDNPEGHHDLLRGEVMTKIDVDVFDRVLDCWRQALHFRIGNSHLGSVKSKSTSTEIAASTQLPFMGQAILEKCSDAASKYQHSGYLCHPGTRSYNIVLDCYASLQMEQAALHLMSKMQHKFDDVPDKKSAKSPQFFPDTTSYNILISMYEKSKRRDSGKKAEELLGRMESQYLAGNEQVRPNLTSYNQTIRALENCHNDAAADRIVMRMHQAYLDGHEL